jgi:hypothetical protein
MHTKGIINDASSQNIQSLTGRGVTIDKGIDLQKD